MSLSVILGIVAASAFDMLAEAQSALQAWGQNYGLSREVSGLLLEVIPALLAMILLLIVLARRHRQIAHAPAVLAGEDWAAFSTVALAPGRANRLDTPDGIEFYLTVGTALALLLLVGGAGGWAATTELEGAVLGAGTVVVDSKVKKVQHPTGGIVAAIHVKLEAIVYPDGSQEQLRHDAEGRLAVAHRRPAAHHRLPLHRGRIGRQAHRRVGTQPALPVGRARPSGRAGKRKTAVVYRFQYDPVGRLLQEQGFDGKTTEYRYNEATGVLAETVDAGVTTKLDFDPMGRLLQRRATAPGQQEQSETFAYTSNGQLAEAQNEHARLQWFYDAAGNLVREHQHYQGPFYPDKAHRGLASLP